MIGTTLADIRERVEELASTDGPYYLACGRTGDRPVPAGTLRFADRATAREAARATEQYRAALRRYDPQVPYYDLIVREDSGSGPRQHERACEPPDATDWSPSVPVLADTRPGSLRRQRTEFCHRVAAAVFETLSDGDYGGVESAVMDAYFELAEAVDDPDDLCLCLLESIAVAFDERLSPDRQASVLSDAASQFPPAERSRQPVASALAVLEGRGLIGEYTHTPAAIDRESGARSVVVTLSDYALSPRNGRLPVLPVVVELYRHRPDPEPATLRVEAVEGGWRVTVEFGDGDDPNSLSNAPIRSA